MVFESGTIVEEGKFNALSKQSGSRFAEMYKIQSEKHRKVATAKDEV
ncbi:MAG: hypothetical protein AAB965_00370 [Patescibacteria group bacterium]